MSVAGFEVSGVEIRPARTGEYAEAGRVTAAAYDEYAPPGGAWSYREQLADVADRARTATVLVAVSDHRIVGTATLELGTRIPSSTQPPPAPDEAHLRMLAVDAAVRRQGIGRRLVEACIELAKRHGKARLTLDTTDAMVAAISMYESMGFRFVGTTDRVPSVCMLMYELRLGPPDV